jgi:hypothetical protein
MKLVKSLMLFAAAVLVGTMSVAAQGQKTWSDEDYDKLMKEIGGAVGATRKAIDGQNADIAKENAEKMAALFVDVEAFWKSRNVADAAKMANDAQSHAKAVAAAVGQVLYEGGGKRQDAAG